MALGYPGAGAQTLRGIHGVRLRPTSRGLVPGLPVQGRASRRVARPTARGPDPGGARHLSTTPSSSCPIGFMTDHMETLYDLDIVAAGAALDAGSRVHARGGPQRRPAYPRCDRQGARATASSRSSRSRQSSSASPVCTTRVGSTHVKHVIIIGGGVAGLGAAYKIRRAADAGHDVDFVLVEKDERLGGKLATEHVPGSRTAAARSSSTAARTRSSPTSPPSTASPSCSASSTTRRRTLDENKKTFIVKDGQARRDARRHHDVRADQDHADGHHASCTRGRRSSAWRSTWCSRKKKRDRRRSATTSRSRASSCAAWAARASTGSPSRSWAA